MRSIASAILLRWGATVADAAATQARERAESLDAFEFACAVNDLVAEPEPEATIVSRSIFEIDLPAVLLGRSRSSSASAINSSFVAMGTSFSIYEK